MSFMSLGGWAAAYQQAESIALTCLVRSRGGPHNPSLSKTVLALALVRSSFFCSGGGMKRTPQFSLFIPHTPVRRGGSCKRICGRTNCCCSQKPQWWAPAVAIFIRTDINKLIKQIKYWSLRVASLKEKEIDNECLY